jgi:hypothetical protein
VQLQSSHSVVPISFPACFYDLTISLSQYIKQLLIILTNSSFRALIRRPIASNKTLERHHMRLEYKAMLKANLARKKLNVKPGVKKVELSTKKKVVNAPSATKKTTKRKPQSPKAASRKRAKR